MITEEIRIPVKGTDRCYRFLQLSDVHVAVPDPQASPEEQQRTERGILEWTPTEGTLRGVPPCTTFERDLAFAAAERVDGLWLTGDSVDMPFGSNVRYLEEKLLDFPCPVTYVIGNHETAGTHDRDLYFPRFSRLAPEPLFSVKEFPGFLVISMDDSSLQITPEQTKLLREQSRRGLPILLLMHIPLCTPAIAPEVLRVWGTTFMLGTEDDPEETRAFCEFVKSPESNVKAVFAGHTHFSHTGEFAPGRMQYVARPCFTGFVRRITVLPE